MRALVILPVSTLILVLFCLTGVSCAEDNVIHASLLPGQDKFITRLVKIKMKTSEKYQTFAMINYNPGNKVMVTEDIWGKSQEIPISEIDQIEFERGLNETSPVAQVGITYTTSEKIETSKTYEMSSNELKIEDGVLILNVPSILIANEDTPDGLDSSITRNKEKTSEEKIILTRPEAHLIIYDHPKDLFYIHIDYVTYERTWQSSGGGSSGMRKGLQ